MILESDVTGGWKTIPNSGIYPPTLAGLVLILDGNSGYARMKENGGYREIRNDPIFDCSRTYQMP